MHQTPPPILRPWLPVQNPKVVIRRRLPWTEIAVHCIALGVTTVLLWLNFSQHFWRQFSDPLVPNELKILQTSAKAHELIMLASLSFVIFHYTRTSLLGSHGLPFGLLSVTYTFQNALISRALWKSHPYRYRFGMFVIFVSLLTLILGPSSAIAMIPELDWFEIKGTELQANSRIAYMATAAELWPKTFNGSLTGNTTADAMCLGDPFQVYVIGCPSSGFPEIAKWLASKTMGAAQDPLFLTEPTSTARREVSVVAHDNKSISSTTTTVTELTATSLGMFFKYATKYKIGPTAELLFPKFRISQETPMYQPVVHVNCEYEPFLQDGKQLRDNVTFPPVRGPWADDIEYQRNPLVLTSEHEIIHELLQSEYGFAWFKDMRSIASSSLLAFFVSKNSPRDQWAIACSVDARWAASSSYYVPYNGSIVSSNLTDNFDWTARENWGRSEENRIKYALSETPLDLQLGWAAYLNQSVHDPEIGHVDQDDSAMVALIKYPTIPIAEYIQNATYIGDQASASDIMAFLETMLASELAVVIADGIARTGTYNRLPVLVTNSTDHETNYTMLSSFFLGRGQYHGINPSYYSRIVSERYGYGYTLRSIPSRLAIACLALYALLVLFHMGYMATSYHLGKYCHCGSWNDVGELLALAMNSAPSARLDGTSGGIDQSFTWQEMVTVRDTGEQHLELRFNADQHERKGKLVQVGKIYA